MKILIALIPLAMMLSPVIKINAQVSLHEDKLYFAEHKSDDHSVKANRGNTGSPHPGIANRLDIDYPKVYKKLSSQFPQARDVLYWELGDFLLTRFSGSGKETSAVYSKHGKMKYSITNLPTDLPSPQTERLTKEYPSYRILYNREINLKDEVIFQMIIENGEEFRVVYMNDETMEVKQQLKKIN